VLALDDAIAGLLRAGYTEVERTGPLEARLGSPSGRPAIRLRVARDGRIFGGSYALELSAEDPVLPPSGGLSARGRGIVKMQGVRFRAKRGDEAGRRLAQQLASNEALGEQLSRVHFERIRVDPDGRPVIRHLGGSVVWVLFPPLVRRIPLVPEQVEATVAALEAFRAASPRRPKP
jgi:Protein of unknown function (DUF3156)